MKKQIFTIILLLMGGVSTFGQFKLDGGTSSVRLQTGGVDRLYVQPVGAPGFYGNIGINTITPNAKLTVAGDMALQKIQRETGSGGYNDYDRQDASIAIFENGGTIGGIQGGSRGQMLYVLCGYGNNQSALTIRHDAASNPTAANRILTHTGADFVITAGAGGVLLIYDDTKARWRIVETPSGSGTAGWGLTGNAGTNPATQFIGTTDAQPLAFKTNNVETMRVLSNGNVGIGTSTPDTKLDVQGDISLKITYVDASVGTQNALNRNNSSVIFFSGIGTVNLNGIAGGKEGLMLHVMTSINATLNINYENSNASPSDRILTNTLGTVSITARGGATFIYTSNRWVLISYAG